MYRLRNFYIVISIHGMMCGARAQIHMLHYAGGIASSDQSCGEHQESILRATIIGAVDRIACFLSHSSCSQILACGLSTQTTCMVLRGANDDERKGHEAGTD